jgi:chromosome segregation ATPase
MIAKLSNNEIEQEIASISDDIDTKCLKLANYKSELETLDDEKKKFVQTKKYKDAKRVKEEITKKEDSITSLTAELTSLNESIA